MKKLFIGCGVVLVLLLAGLGFLVWSLYPDMKGMMEAWETGMERLAQLDEIHAFDAASVTTIEPSRFATHLDLRVELADYLQSLEQGIGDMADGQADEEDQRGWIDLSRLMVRTMTPVPSEFADRFERWGTGPSEFRYYSRVLWAVLRDLDKGAGGEQFNPLRDRFSILKQHYEDAARRHDEAPPLDTLIGSESDFPEAVLATARAIIASDVERTRAGSSALTIEPLYLQLGVGEEGGLQAIWLDPSVRVETRR